MNLTISPYRYSIKSIPAFKANEESATQSEKEARIKERKEAYGNGCADGTTIGCFSGLLGALMLATMVVGIKVSGDNSSRKKLAEFYNNVDSVMKSGEIDTDTFTITDVNKDKSPDFILYTKDGKKIILDMKNNKMLEESTTLKEMK